MTQNEYIIEVENRLCTLMSRYEGALNKMELLEKQFERFSKLIKETRESLVLEEKDYDIKFDE